VPRHPRRLVVALAIVTTGFVRCSSSGTSPSDSCSPGGTTICAANTAFNPAALTVAVGATVTFHNSDGFTHTTTSSAVPNGAAAWDVSLAGGAQTTVTFSIPGTYQYYCKIHGTATSGMRGTIVVQ
jgi:plastocyanin